MVSTCRFAIKLLRNSYDLASCILRHVPRQKMKDIHISVTPRDATGALLTKRNSPDASIPVKHREQLEVQQGDFIYDTADLDGGNLEICIQSYTASMESPSRVALSVSAQAAADDDVMQQLEQDRVVLNRKLESENRLLKEETSRITAELVRMQRRAKSIAGDAQFSKKREETFHNQSLSLNKAVKIWPIVRMIVVMIGGYLQVSHVIAYMKSRHIC
jgi:emp24/gp25L/p24 family/GOLD